MTTTTTTPITIDTRDEYGEGTVITVTGYTRLIAADETDDDLDGDGYQVWVEVVEDTYQAGGALAISYTEDDPYYESATPDPPDVSELEFAARDIASDIARTLAAG